MVEVLGYHFHDWVSEDSNFCLLGWLWQPLSQHALMKRAAVLKEAHMARDEGYSLGISQGQMKSKAYSPATNRILLFFFFFNPPLSELGSLET